MQLTSATCSNYSILCSCEGGSKEAVAAVEATPAELPSSDALSTHSHRESSVFSSWEEG